MSLPIAVELKSIRENYDTTNPVVADILKAKEQRMKILQELNRQQEEEFSAHELKLQSTTVNGQSSETEKGVGTKKIKTNTNFPLIAIRRSSRLSNSPRVGYRELEETDIQEVETPKPEFIRPPNDYGAVPGVEIGFHWETRLECSRYGVHRPTVAGIHGGPRGAYSIALSGGYPEDVDKGYTFLYTGAGGRDLKGTATQPKNLRIAPQTKDQQLEGTNLSLVRSIESKLPIRVIRGYKSPSVFAPETGYRYDGLYQVVEYWEDVGKSGHRIFRFRMERVKDQPPPPWEQPNKSKNQRRRAYNESRDGSDEYPDDFKENQQSNACDDVRATSKSNQEEQQQPQLDTYANDQVVDVDGEIEKCIRSFCKTEIADDWKVSLSKNSDESEFQGWDEIQSDRLL